MEFYTALKRNEAVIFSRKEMELDKVSQTQKCKYNEVRDEAALVECLLFSCHINQTTHFPQEPSTICKSLPSSVFL